MLCNQAAYNIRTINNPPSGGKFGLASLPADCTAAFIDIWGQIAAYLYPPWAASLHWVSAGLLWGQLKQPAPIIATQTSP